MDYVSGIGRYYLAPYINGKESDSHLHINTIPNDTLLLGFKLTVPVQACHSMQHTPELIILGRFLILFHFRLGTTCIR